MPPDLYYPDVVPPPGWPYYRQGMQIRLVPPDRDIAAAEATIVISPLVPRRDTLPSPEELIESAIFAEARMRFEVVSQKGPTAVKAATGLQGVSYEVTGYVRPRFPREKRIYVMYADPLCYSAISYLAAEAAFDRHVDSFWKTAKSVRPFSGAVVAPSGLSPVALLYSD